MGKTILYRRPGNKRQIGLAPSFFKNTSGSSRSKCPPGAASKAFRRYGFAFPPKRAQWAADHWKIGNPYPIHEIRGFCPKNQYFTRYFLLPG
jgi:hypothetical protein